MNIALYGGSFDPPHLGHLQVVHAALKTLDVDKVIVVPTFVNPFKSGSHAPAPLRVQWLKRIFAHDEDVEVSEIEVRENRPVPTIETVEKLVDKYDKIYCIIGADNLASLKQWHRYHELDRLVTWVIATRDDIMINEHYIQLNVNQPVSSSELREKIDKEHLPGEVALAIKNYYEKQKEPHAR